MSISTPFRKNETSETSQQGAEIDAKEDGEEGYEFRLFSTVTNNTNFTSSSPSKPLPKIILRDKTTEGAGDGGFVAPRSLEYIWSTPSTALRSEYELSAVTGEVVLEWAKSRAWGLEVPWRVKVLRDAKRGPAKLSPKDVGITQLPPDISEREDRNRSKPGKKQRILHRERRRKGEMLEEQRRKEQAAKQESEKEKKTRRNREKKVKRKLKEKAKKTGGVDDVGGGQEVGFEDTRMENTSE